MTTSRQIDASLSHSILDESEESNLTPRDTGVLQTVMGEGLTVFTFDVLKRLTGLHQENLSSIIDRLEEESLQENRHKGYTITPNAPTTIPLPLTSAIQLTPIDQS